MVYGMNKRNLFVVFLLKVLSFLIMLTSTTSFSNQREYHLEVKKEVVNKSGKKEVDFALTINGGIPAPTLRFVEGDEAIIHVKNSTNEETSIHWHGLLLPWNMDGVPYINNPPIQSGQTFTFRFKLRQTGTYWYHSHTNLQEQRGVYGAIVIEPKKQEIAYDHELVLVLSDWIDEHPQAVLARLKRDGDSYAWKKNTVSSIAGAIQRDSLGAYLKNEWVRMGGMDYSDVGYDAFLINGNMKNENVLTGLKKGDKIRLRVINAGASTYFHVNIGKKAFDVISADGIDVVPVSTKEVLIGMAETYDLLFTMPSSEAFEFRATAQDITGYSSLIIGDGVLEKAPDRVKPNLYKMSMSGMDHMSMGAMDHMNMGDMDHSKMKSMKMDHGKMDSMKNKDCKMGSMKMDHGKMDHCKMGSKNMAKDSMDSDILVPLKYSELRSKTPTNFPKDTPTMEFKIALGGDMERYVWWLNGELLSEDSYIDIEEGSVVRFILQNGTMMHHPMHLHGHFFRLLNGQGDFSPLKHTVDVSPMGTKTIEFLANEPGQWFFHCHNLYHIKQGMGRVIRYKNFDRGKEPEFMKTGLNKMLAHDSKFYPRSKISLYSNMAKWSLGANGGRYALDIEGNAIEYDAKKMESTFSLKRYFSKYFSLLAGIEVRDLELSGIAGFSYVIPLNFEVMAYLNTESESVLSIEKMIQISKHFYFETEAEFRWVDDMKELEEEYGFGLSYSLNRQWAIGVSYDRIEELETEDRTGFGVSYKW